MFLSDNKMIVRRILKCKAEVGRCIEITRRTTSGYWGRYLGENKEFFIAERLNNFREISIVTVEIKALELEALRHAKCMHHDLSPAWRKVLSIKPEIIKFWNTSGVIYIWPEVIKRRIFGHNPMVYIDIKNRVYVSNSK